MLLVRFSLLINVASKTECRVGYVISRMMLGLRYPSPVDGNLHASTVNVSGLGRV